MNLSEKINLFTRMDAIIRRRGTGAPKDFAARLAISERTLYGYISLLKELGGPIYFCHRQNSYCYEFEVTFSIGFLPSSSSLLEVRGGQGRNFYNYFSHCKFPAVLSNIFNYQALDRAIL